MDDKRVIRFPTERRLQAAARARAEAPRSQAVPAEQIEAFPGESFVFLSVEVRRLPRAGSWIGGDVAGRILNRCVLSCLEILSKERIPVDLAGTVLRPVLEATFSGPDAAVRAAKAGLAVREAIRKVQREMENEFHLFGAITTGVTSELESGVTVTSGSPQQVAARVREHAAPGQILMSHDAWGLCEDTVDVLQPAVPVTVPGAEPVPTYPLTALKS
jgi:hypothetical protein